MRVCASLSYALFASVSFARLLTPTPAVSDPTTTPAPEVPMELFRKQNDNRYVGWVSLYGTGWTAESCDIGSTYYQRGISWGCCSTAYPSCEGAVGCVTGSLIYRISSSGTRTSTLTTIDCTSGATNALDRSYSVCYTGLLYESTGASTDPRTWIACQRSSSSQDNYYRTKPPTTTTSPSTSPISTTTTTSSSSTTTTPIPGPTVPPAPENKSQAWIAGAVIGPIVGIALIGAILFFFFRRKKKNPDPTLSPMQQHSQPIADGSAFYDTQQKPSMVPVGVDTHGSTLPHQQQQWQHLPQQGQQVYPPPQPSSTGSPSPQYQQPLFNGQSHEERPFSVELDGGGSQGTGSAVAPHSPPGQNR